MNIEQLRDFCLSFKGVTEELPFGPDTLVFKVMGKMFALLPLDLEELVISLKNTPDRNAELRQEYPFIQGAFHMNKTHWNMVFIDFSVKSNLVKELVTDSYNLVVESLTKKLKSELQNI